MKRIFAAMATGIGLWLASGGMAHGQTQFIKPNGNSPFQKPSVNPFQFLPQNNLGSGALYNNPGFGANPGTGLGTAFVDPWTLQQGLVPPVAVAPASGLPFSTLPPPAYFFNYQPFYPLIPLGGATATTAPIAGAPLR